MTKKRKSALRYSWEWTCWKAERFENWLFELPVFLGAFVLSGGLLVIAFVVVLAIGSGDKQWDAYVAENCLSGHYEERVEYMPVVVGRVTMMQPNTVRDFVCDTWKDGTAPR